MTERVSRAGLWLGAAAVAVVAVASVRWRLSIASGVLFGGILGVANLVCLEHLSSLWLNGARSRKQVVWWMIVKGPLLYGLALWGMMSPMSSAVGLALGFSVILVCVLVAQIVTLTRSLSAFPAHGR
jgi:hypothetical protein